MSDNEKYVDWLDEIVKRHEKEGGFDNLPGIGKPLPKEQLKDDLLTTVIKRSGYKPDWLSKQKKIFDKLEHIVSQIHSEKDTSIISKLINEVNYEIKQYNLGCPFAMQKNYVTRENIEQQRLFWK